MPASTHANITVVIPAYNCATFIERAFQSLFAQTLQPTEIIVVNDCSTDNTRDVVLGFAKKYPMIRLYENSKNSGVSAGRNVGIENAKGDWIAFLDADDAFTPKRLEELWQAATTHNLDLVTDNQTNFDSITKTITNTTIYNPTQQVMMLRAEPFVKGSSFFPTLREVLGIGLHPHYPLMKWMVKHEFLKAHGLRYDTLYRVSEDFHFGVVALAVGKAGVVPTPGYIYTESVSAKTGKKSLTSKTVTSFQQTIASLDNLLEQFPLSTHPELHRLLKRRKASVVVYQHADTIKNKLRQKEFAGALKLFLQNPALLWILLYKISKAIRHRFWRLLKR